MYGGFALLDLSLLVCRMKKVLELYSYAKYTRRFSLYVFFCWFLSIKQWHSLILTLSYNNVISGNATDNILFRNFKLTFTLRICI